MDQVLSVRKSATPRKLFVKPALAVAAL